MSSPRSLKSCVGSGSVVTCVENHRRDRASSAGSPAHRIELDDPEELVCRNRERVETALAYSEDDQPPYPILRFCREDSGSNAAPHQDEVTIRNGWDTQEAMILYRLF